MKNAFFILMAIVTVARGQVQYAFTNFAGLPGGYGNVDGIGNAARFNDPSGLAVDGVGNLYVADSGNATIRKITPDGVVTTLAGSPGNRGNVDGIGWVARFRNPRGVAVDSGGNVYVADGNNNTIRKITSAGVVTTLAGQEEDLDGDGYTDGSYADGTGSEARFDYPFGVAVDGAGTVYVADASNYVVRKITPDRLVATLAGAPGEPGSTDGLGAAAHFKDPRSVAVDSAGNVYVGEGVPFAVRKITPDGKVTTLANSAFLTGCANCGGYIALAVDGPGNVYVSDRVNMRVRKITPDRVVTNLAGSSSGQDGNTDGIGNAARFADIAGLAVDGGGNVYAADGFNQTIRKITPDQVVTTLAGSSGYGSVNGTGTAARFRDPRGVGIDKAGNVYVADSSNHTIRKITPDGVVTTLAGSPGQFGKVNGTGAAARFDTPSGLAVDAAGNIFVTESGNHTIRKITPAAVVTTLAGSPGQVGDADGKGSTARFNQPIGVAVDTTGNLYVTEWLNHTIRKIRPDGEVTTLAGSAGLQGSTDGTGAEALFDHPRGIAVDKAGYVYVADVDNDTIRKITASGVVSTLAGQPGQSGNVDGVGIAARFAAPIGVAIDNTGDLFVTDGYAIRKVTPEGIATTIAGSSEAQGSADGLGRAAQFSGLQGVAVDSAANLYLADSDRITKGTPLLIVAPPTLQIISLADGVSISWPASAAGFILESADSIPASANWIVETTAPLPVGDQNAVMIKIGRATRFFRLRK